MKVHLALEHYQGTLFTLQYVIKSCNFRHNNKDETITYRFVPFVDIFAHTHVAITIKIL